MEPAMGEGQAGGSKPFDPLESFRGLRDIYLDSMAKAMVDAVNTESYAKASAAVLDTTLTLSAPLREGLEKSMLQILEKLSLPSRQDIVALAERFANLEMRLDDMDAKLDRLLGLSHPAQPGVPAETAAKKPAAPSTPAVESGPAVTEHVARPRKSAPARKAARK
jgi:hypothetical protein